MLLFEPLWFWSAAIVLVCRHWPLSVVRAPGHGDRGFRLMATSISD